MVIVITLPQFVDGEAGRIVRLLQAGVDLVHVRKPGATGQQTERLIAQIPAEWRRRLVLHDHFRLAAAYGLHGVHLNSRNPQPPEGWQGSVSRSCHTLDEVVRWKPLCDYVSLSPVFDSLSKPGYRAAFTPAGLARARAEGIIDNKVMALGGVTFGRIDDVLRMGFGGAMILGDAWKTACADGGHALRAVGLSVAGSDSSAGAGIQQDMKAMAAAGVYCATVITAVTSQNTLGVQGVMPVPPEVVGSQLRAVLADMNVCGVKIGMIPDAGVAHAVAEALAAYRQSRPCAVVYDPVMVATSGRRLMDAEALETVRHCLLPVCTLVTPNLPEAGCLLGHAYTGDADGTELARRYGVPFLVKGGHGRQTDADSADGRPPGSADTVTDTLFDADGTCRRYESRRIASHNLHGTGCALSSAIVAYTVAGHPVPQAIALAKLLVADAIDRSKDEAYGMGNGPLLFG